MNRKLIALDLDGTTLNDTQQITLETQEVLNKLRKEGHLISIVTGRPYRNSYYYYNQLKMDTPIVNFNGAWCHNPSDKKWEHGYHKTLSKDLAISMLSLKDDPEVQLIAAESRDGIYVHGDFIPYPDYFPEGIEVSRQLTSETLLVDPTSVEVFTNTQLNQPIIEERIIKNYGNAVEVRTWGGLSPCLEVVAAGVQKAMGVERIASYYNINQKDIIAFGDEENDYEMIQYAGEGIVMKNGNERLKAIANDLTAVTNHENGLAEYLTRYFKL
ncbi:Cof-type HAD-IIB family hydrolase [Marinilactibacillus psychrotolerans]|uniref:Haloacid dehalogenase n=1 Tax=Marinilactibacillus psychrotolerans TaxID=191770 RepID=A0AAV3WTG5_9LACT|nr:Cof-type HAD-IIB family hydrolase [Marinilactibacillus psychrotolerans]GEL68086.1 haloacid dehalogenase [Marinilactibacillus psychrotolerans]GEQ36816.1 haloacid dehalogenase [Marinilactibacillus psychrotolerans]SDD35653.1 hypothetical protein SAMN04488013_12714 [Marinilactibacillus psychrotolerans]